MNLDCGNVGVAGFYTFELNGVPVYEVPSKNLITDFGWNRLLNLAAAAASGSALQVGTSNTTPATGDTALGAFLAQKVGNSSAVVGSGSDANGAYSYSRWGYSFAQGAVVGNVAEVGWKVSSGDASITSRSLTKDAGGNPAVIVVTAIDQLTVNYELRYYRNTLDTTGSVTIAGTPTTYTLRHGTFTNGTSQDANQIGGMLCTNMSITHYGTGSSLGAAGAGTPSGSGAGASFAGTTTSRTVNTSTGTVTWTSPVVGVSSGNTAGGVVNIYIPLLENLGNTLGAYGEMKVGFSPAIPKDGTKTVSYSVSFTFTRM